MKSVREQNIYSLELLKYYKQELKGTLLKKAWKKLSKEDKKHIIKLNEAFLEEYDRLLEQEYTSKFDTDTLIKRSLNDTFKGNNFNCYVDILDTSKAHNNIHYCINIGGNNFDVNTPILNKMSPFTNIFIEIFYQEDMREALQGTLNGKA